MCQFSANKKSQMREVWVGPMVSQLLVDSRRYMSHKADSVLL